MTQPRFVSGLWEYVWPNDCHQGGYLNAYEVTSWDSHKRSPGQPGAPTVSGDVMTAIVARQAALHDLARSVIQRDSYHTLGGEVFPALDHLSWEADQVRVDSQSVLEHPEYDEARLVNTTFHLAPDQDGLYHLDQLGWDLYPVASDAQILRPVASGVRPYVDAVGRSAVESVEIGERSYLNASRAKLATIAILARRAAGRPVDGLSPQAPQPRQGHVMDI